MKDDTKGHLTENPPKSLRHIKLSSDELLRRPDLTAVDGVLYDVHNIAREHPGGDVVFAAGVSRGFKRVFFFFLM